MNSTTPTPVSMRSALPSPSDGEPVPVQIKLAAAWTSFMFFYLYMDYLLLYKPGFIDALRASRVHEFDISVAFAISALLALAVPILMILLSVALPPRANRVLNLVVATLYIPFTAYNISGAESWLPLVVLAVALELALTACILRWAWMWKAAR